MGKGTSGKIWTIRVKVFWTKTAVENLSAIYTYIAQNSPQYAARIADRITRRSEQLANFPMSGRIVPEFETEKIREVIEGSYRIIYYIKSGTNRCACCYTWGTRNYI